MRAKRLLSVDHYDACAWPTVETSALELLRRGARRPRARCRCLEDSYDSLSHYLLWDEPGTMRLFCVDGGPRHSHSLADDRLPRDALLSAPAGERQRGIALISAAIS